VVKSTLPVTEIRKKIFKIIDEAEKTGRNFTITKEGIAKAVLMPADEWESWLKTLEVTITKKFIHPLKNDDSDWQKRKANPWKKAKE